MNMSVRNATSRSRHMEITTGSIAQGIAPLQLGSEVMAMSKAEGLREAKYQAAMHMARRFLNDGVINEEDYRNFDTKMTKKYKPILGDLFSDISLKTVDK